jgi:putative DNA-invertase from lambdoid prophage Rac
MSRIFAYCRVSTAEQTTANQVAEIAAAGFAIERQRTITETVSGSVAACQRPGFVKLLDRLEAGDSLIVTKLDRLGRNTMDVLATVEKLADMGVAVRVLALGGVDLTSAAGKMTITVLAAVAQFERDLLIERTQSGLARTKAAGTKLGRQAALSAADRAAAIVALGAGESVSSVARKFGTSRQTVLRAKEAA